MPSCYPPTEVKVWMGRVLRYQCLSRQGTNHLRGPTHDSYLCLLRGRGELLATGWDPAAHMCLLLSRAQFFAAPGGMVGRLLDACRAAATTTEVYAEGRWADVSGPSWLVVPPAENTGWLRVLPVEKIGWLSRQSYPVQIGDAAAACR